MSARRFPGTLVDTGGRKLLVPALSLRQYEELGGRLEALEKLGSDTKAAVAGGVLRDVTEIVHAAVSRNYPDLTIEELGDLIDMRNMGDFVSAATGASQVSPGGRSGGGCPLAEVDWGSLQADLVALTGWPFSEVGEITLPRLAQLTKAWKRHPPMVMLLEMSVGWKAPEEVAEIPEQEARAMDDWLAKRLDDLAQGKG